MKKSKIINILQFTKINELLNNKLLHMQSAVKVKNTVYNHYLA